MNYQTKPKTIIKPISFETLEISKISLTPSNKSNYVMKYFDITNGGNQLTVVFPPMQTKFGISKYENKTKPGTYDYSLAQNFNHNQQLLSTFNKAEELDEFIINTMITKFRYLFGTLSDIEIRNLYFPMLKDKLRFPKLSSSVKLDENGFFTFRFIDEVGEKTKLNKMDHPLTDRTIIVTKTARELFFNKNTLQYGIVWVIDRVKIATE